MYLHETDRNLHLRTFGFSTSPRDSADCSSIRFAKPAEKPEVQSILQAIARFLALLLGKTQPLAADVIVTYLNVLWASTNGYARSHTGVRLSDSDCEGFSLCGVKQLQRELRICGFDDRLAFWAFFFGGVIVNAYRGDIAEASFSVRGGSKRGQARVRL